MTTLRLVLADQLNPCHSWFDEQRSDVVYVLMEVRQETDYVLHDAQKILALFAAMRDFARRLEHDKHRVHYIRIGDADNDGSFAANLDRLLEHYEAQQLQYQLPDECSLDTQLGAYAKQLGERDIRCEGVDSEHFFTDRDEVENFFAGKKQWLMERFYRKMRLKHGVLVEPDGLYWDFHARHRGKLSGNFRLSMVYRQLDKMTAEERRELHKQARGIRRDLDGL